MKESMNVAKTLAWKLTSKGKKKRFITAGTETKMQGIHIHCPEGATPKDGPSAGITMVSSLLSLLTNTPIINNLAMTGEITLTGKILAIGGMKEKIIAAKRSGFNNLIFPKDNVKDYAELPKHITQGVKVHFVNYYDEVIKLAFPHGLKKKRQ